MSFSSRLVCRRLNWSRPRKGADIGAFRGANFGDEADHRRNRRCGEKCSCGEQVTEIEHCLLLQRRAGAAVEVEEASMIRWRQRLDWCCDCRALLRAVAFLQFFLLFQGGAGWIPFGVWFCTAWIFCLRSCELCRSRVRRFSPFHDLTLVLS